MSNFIEYRKLENNKNLKDFIDFYNMHGVEKLISVIKHTGITINPYNSEHRYKTLVDDIFNYLKLHEKELDGWDKMQTESILLNSLYSDLYSSNSYQKTNEIDENEELLAFIIVLEKVLNYISNIILGRREKNDLVNYEFSIDFAYDKALGEPLKTSKLFDNISLSANDVLTYLMFYKYKNKKIDINLSINNDSIIKAFAHLINIDKKNVIDDLVNEWKLNCREISKQSRTIKIDYLGDFARDYFIVSKRMEHRRTLISNDLAYARKHGNLVDNIKEQQNIEYSICEDEVISKEYLKTILNISDFKHTGIINKRNSNYNISLDVLIRAFSVLKVLSSKYIEEHQDINSHLLENVCLVMNRTEICSSFTSYGIPLTEIDKLIEILTYTSYTN